MAKIKKALIVTVYNEEDTVESLLASIHAQSEKPDQIVIVDGGSKDKTVSKAKEIVLKFRNRVRYRILVKRGNRSVGRNEAISRAKADIIAITDAGCLLDKNWFKFITKPFSDASIDVVSGYYKAKTASIFEKCLVPYVFVMPDQINPSDFLPATRSMAIRKSIWKKAGRFDESLSNNEDYAFARRLKSMGFRIKFVKSAFVNWIPRVNLKQAFIMFFRFALGDIEAKILRPKVVLVFLRYTLGIYLLFINLYLFFALFVFYFIWAIFKNFRYIKNLLACLFLPLIQLTADLAVLTGSIVGFLRIFNNSWLVWAKMVNRKVKLYEHFNILAASLFISICLYIVIISSFPLQFSLPEKDVINWYFTNNYPKQADYFYFEVGFLFITVTTLFLWVIKVWSKAKR